MYDEKLIRKICDLTCTKDDVVRSQTTVKYDTSHPFEKYYSLATIKGALEKFISNDWDDITLSHWACLYCWVLSGGCEDPVTEDLTTLEVFLRDVITWDLDGLAFFDAEYEEDMRNSIQLFEDYDHILQTASEWNAVYAMIGPYAQENGSQYVALINSVTKEYMIIYSEFLENGYEDKYFKLVAQEDFLELIERLKSESYRILTCSEKYLYMELEE